MCVTTSERESEWCADEDAAGYARAQKSKRPNERPNSVHACWCVIYGLAVAEGCWGVSLWLRKREGCERQTKCTFLKSAPLGLRTKHFSHAPLTEWETSVARDGPFAALTYTHTRQQTAAAGVFHRRVNKTKTTPWTTLLRPLNWKNVAWWKPAKTMCARH